MSPQADLVTAAGEVPGYLGPTAALVVAAAVIGYLTARARVVPIVGFLVAGVLIGPAQFGVVDSSEAVEAAADIGVILLLFTIGIEFSLERLARVWTWIAVAGGLQLVLATGAGLGVTLALGGGWRDGLFTGFLLALSSTAIVLKLLGERRENSAVRGRLALAVLIAQDLAVVAMVLVVPLLGPTAEGGGSGGGALLWAVLTAVGVIVAVLVLARRVMPTVLDVVARTCSPEVFLLAIVAVCFGTAYLTALAGVSVSLGAFLAGLVVSESRASTQALAEVLPLQIVFSAVFFVSVGMLLDVGFMLANLPLVLGAAAGALVLKTLTTAVAATAVGIRLRTAAATGLLLAQVGEFSFVLLTVGTAAGLAPLGLADDGAQVVVAATVLLMLATPQLAAAAARLDRSRGAAAGPVSADEDGAHRDHVAIIGWGPTALELAGTLRDRGVGVVMTTLNPDGAAQAEADGHTVVRGDPTKGEVLRVAGVPAARVAVVAEDDPEQAVRVVAAARAVTTAPIVARPLGAVDVVELADAGADHVLDRDRISGHALERAVLAELGHRVAHPDRGRTVVDTTRVVRYAWPDGSGCGHGDSSRPVVPWAHGCVGCLREGTEWVHLRTCLSCGYVGCCDSSPRRHARLHAAADDHPLVASAEPGESWAYCFVDDVTVPAPGGAAPEAETSAAQQ
ncbi:Kef-type potassium/proton antiporter, CPA2 family [Blastococcus sp. DSM 46786]|uniref:cation:proton antiporter domain-containing protein n=1 Tax=Blastococcus sp. DSM 46786 TaxID=1798227 RepID=UPI0008BBCD75|nr:cation:proton antiporter [Blastococcus sp. DSM 46786]SEM07829.1 Kef-type potassium/proton antiporter, CPA2 family [Blastococcus sp. DSM 46786]